MIAIAVAAALLAAEPAKDADAVVACLDITSDERRLACFDREARLLRDGVAEAAEAEFGEEQLASTREAVREEEQDRPRSIEVKVASLAYDDRDRAVFTLENGQVWREKKPSVGRIYVREGEELSVRIKRRVFSGYRMRIIGSGKIIDVERLK
ncbi:MAG: hypothetical protein AAFR11_06535 [Pseudomonadota bacterium]